MDGVIVLGDLELITYRVTINSGELLDDPYTGLIVSHKDDGDLEIKKRIYDMLINDGFNLNSLLEINISLFRGGIPYV